LDAAIHAGLHLLWCHAAAPLAVVVVCDAHRKKAVNLEAHCAGLDSVYRCRPGHSFVAATGA
jgi:hypothetical protein